MEKICQSCGMPIFEQEQLGTNKDGSLSKDYCKYCYKDGEFIDKVSMEEYIEMCSQFGEQAGMTNEEMRKHCEKLFPTLKRWKGKNIVYSEPMEFIPKEVRKELKIGEFAENSNKKIVMDDEDLMLGYKLSDLSNEAKKSSKGNKISNKK